MFGSTNFKSIVVFLLKYSLQYIIYFCKESLNDIINNEKISIQINEDNKKYSCPGRATPSRDKPARAKKDNEERFYE
jgi:hypothetical protein